MDMVVVVEEEEKEKEEQGFAYQICGAVVHIRPAVPLEDVLDVIGRDIAQVWHTLCNKAKDVSNGAGRVKEWRAKSLTWLILLLLLILLLILKPFSTVRPPPSHTCQTPSTYGDLPSALNHKPSTRCG